MDVIDFFSYWIFIWFLCYTFGWTSYNPFVWLCIAFSFFLVAIYCMFYYQNDGINIRLFSLEALLTKMIPIAILWNSSIQWKDIQAGFFLLCIYLPIEFGNKKLFYPNNTYYQSFLFIQKNQPFTPITIFMKKMVKKYWIG